MTGNIVCVALYAMRAQRNPAGSVESVPPLWHRARRRARLRWL